MTLVNRLVSGFLKRRGHERNCGIDNGWIARRGSTTCSSFGERTPCGLRQHCSSGDVHFSVERKGDRGVRMPVGRENRC